MDCCLLTFKKIRSIEIQSVMICCVIPSSSFVPSFNSIHDTLQEIWAIENSISLIPTCHWDKVTSAVNQPISAVLLFIVFNGCPASGHCVHHFTHNMH